MAFTSQTVNTTAESGVTIQEMWEEVRSEEHVAEICWDTWAVALKSNTGVRAFIHKTVMNEVIKKVKKKKKSTMALRKPHGYDNSSVARYIWS